MSALSRITDRPSLFNLEIAVRSLAQAARPRGPLSANGTDIFLCLVDHYEPQVGNPSRELAQERVRHWVDHYPRIADKHTDFDSRKPTHGFFYPWDEYNSWEMNEIAALCRQGYGEVEVHLHHKDDTKDSLRKMLREAISAYQS